MRPRFKEKAKGVACVLFALFSCFSAEARKAYVETHWDDISASSQTIKLMNGSTQVGTVTTSTKGIGDTGDSVATGVAPVYPTGGYSTSSKRNYGCKTVGNLVVGSDRIYVQGTGWKIWNRDLPAGAQVDSWDGYRTAPLSDDAVIYCQGADADPIFDVYNYKLNYTASGWSGPYDGNLHYISVSVGTSGCTVEYSIDNDRWITTNRGYRELGKHTVYYRIKRDSQIIVSGSEVIEITEGIIRYSASGVEVWEDGNSHSINLSVSSPSGCTIEYSVNGTNGWTTSKPTYSAVGVYTTHFRISKANYTTVTDSRTVTIKALQDLEYSSSGYVGIYDGYYHGISVSVVTPSSGYSIRYSTSSNGSYQTSSYTYRDVSTNTVWYQISATGYRTVKGFEQVIITPKTIGPEDILNPSYTNYTYTGSQPWYDRSGYYTVLYGTNYWGVGWWWAEFRGYGNYTGVLTNWFEVVKKSATITSGSRSRGYTGSPLTYDYATSSGFVSGEGVQSYDVTGSQLEVGYSPNYFTYMLKTNTDPRNYDISVVTGRLTVTAVTPVSLRYPVRMDIEGTNRITVGVQETYRSRVTYSDGSSGYYSSSWSLTPNDALINRTFSGSYTDLTAKPDGAGSEHTLSARYSDTSYSTAAMVTNGLVAWYPFDGNLSDMGFYKHDLSRDSSLYATYVADRTETSSRALRFAGNSSGYAYVYNPAHFTQMTNAFTISAWLKPEDYTKLGLTYWGGQFALRFRETGEWLFNSTTINCSKALALNVWQYVTLTWDGTTLVAFLDGTEIGRTALSGPLTVGSGYFYLGRAVQGGTTEYFMGAVDDFRLFDRVLTAEEIALIKSGTDVISASSTITVSNSKKVTVEPRCRIPVAVDVESATGSRIGSTSFSFTTGCSAAGGEGWYGQYAVNSGIHDDVYDYDAAQSGKFTGPGRSWMLTSTAGAGKLSFWWKTDCEATYDYLVFMDNSHELARLSGSNDWRQMTFDLAQGSHNFRWEYVKDGKNDVGADAAWVDRLVWTTVSTPSVPSGKTTLVNATDGTYDKYVYVTWGEPKSEWTVTGYRVLRKVANASDSTYTNLSGTVTARAFTDVAAVPGVEYTYKVEAENAAGSGSCGTDNGYRGVVLKIDPSSCHFPNVPRGESVSVTVVSNALWKATPNQSWLHAAVSNGQFTVTADDNPASSRRSGTITVYGGLYANGSTLPHYVRQTFTVTQSASVDIGFEHPYVDWRTQLQVTSTNEVSGYAPVSVFTTGEPIRLSFGWRNWSDVAVELPAVKFRVRNAATDVVLSWTDNGADVVEGLALAAKTTKACGFWNADNLRTLPPGDYQLEAELDPENLLDDPKRQNNTAVFRFAIRDPFLEFGKDVFSAACWTNLVVSNGNDYAQAPHVARRTVEIVTNNVQYAYETTAVQFGPYVPMNGVNGRLIEKKKPVDIVLLIDFTGSMDACIAGLMNNIGNFIDRLMIGDSERGISPIDDLRIKIVGFSDYQSDCTYKNWMQEYAFTTDRKLLKEQLNELKGQCYGGGGNGGESSYDALYYICKGWSTVWDGASQPTAKKDTASPFRPLDEAARAVVMFTDEPPHVLLDAPGCKNVGIDGLDSAIREAGVNLTIIGDGWYYREYPEYEANIHWLNDLMIKDPKRRFTETYPRTLADFTQDTSDLQSLAETIVLQTPSVATVVEPSFTAVAQGEGTLTFRWCNDSTSTGTNNAFTFTGEGLTNIVRYGTTGKAWRDEKIVFNYDGLHPLKWTYRKLGYEGSVVDCGLVTDVLWARRATELEVIPLTATLDCLGTNKVQMTTQVVDNVIVPCKAFGATFDVRCNSIWKVVTNGVPEWVRLVQDSGNGDGSIVITVDENPDFKQRTCAITVRAGEYGRDDDDIVERQVFVVQDGAEPVPGPNVQILSVDVKPRWPWKRKVDVDFRIVLPADGTPATITLTGLNGEGGDMVDDFPVLKQLKECPAKSKVTHGYGKEQTDAKVDSTTKLMYITCSTSGYYRISWEMGKDWYDAGLAALKLSDLGLGKTNLDTTRNPWELNKFHTPAFSVRLKATCAGHADVKKPSNVVRVDTRIVDMTDASKDPYTLLAPAGGKILTGIEWIGHPDGAVDPVAYDTRDSKLFPSNGWNSLDFVTALDKVWSNRYESACVINDDAVSIEGGMITSKVTWAADRIHVVRDNVFVTRDGLLEIEEGAVIKFCDCTHLYVYEDKDKPDQTESRHNIVVKGAYFTYGYDGSYGGDTLYHKTEQTWWNAGQNVVYSQGTADDCVKLTERNKGPDEVEATTYSDWPTERAILRVELKETFRDPTKADVVTTPHFKYRYYSYEQTWGALPRPNRDGCAFYGWYTADPKSITPDEYRTKTSNMLDESKVPYSKPLSKTIYALVCSTNWADAYGGTLWPFIDASSGSIRLDANSVVYDGDQHKPEVTRLMVGGELVSPDVYETQYGPGNYITAGVYRVGVSFKSTYTNSPAATFEILPRSVEGGTVVVDPPSALYRPNADGGVALPSVKVFLPLKDGADPVEIPYAQANWYDLEQDATHYWPRPGTYHVEVKFDANYSGTLTNEFAIEKNPEYDFTSSKFAKSTAEEAAAEAKKNGKRILYFAGEVPEDAATAYVKSLITDDIDTNEWTIANFVCWTDRADSAAFARYSAGLDEVACPLICVLNPNDLETPIVRTCGYQTKEQLMGFLAASLTAPVDASAATVAFRTGKGAFTYNDEVQKPVPGDLYITYAGAELSASTYDLVFENAASEDVGTYDVWARLKPNTWVGGYLVTGETAAVSYTIGAQEVWDGMDPVIRARLGIGLNPPAAVYNGSVQRPAVTSVVAYASTDYGTDDWFNIGTHTVKVTFDGNYSGTVSEAFAITAQEVVSPTVELDRYEEYVSSKQTEDVRPNVLRVYDATRTYVETADYTVDYGERDYTSPGTNTITVGFCGNYSGEVRINFVIRAVGDVSDGPTVEGDPGAVVTGDATTGYVITPSAGRNEVTVVIPNGVSPSKVTVRLLPTVKVVKPSGTTMRIVRGEYSYDIRENLNFTTNAEDAVDLENATVKEEVVNEIFDTAKGAKVSLDPSNPSLSVVTCEGLLYSFREGATIEAEEADEPVTHVGDGKTWDLPISVKGGSSAFYGVGIEK